MGLVSIFSFVTTMISKHNLKFNLLDGLVMLFGVTTFFSNNYVQNSDAITKQILLILIIILYFYYRLAFQLNKYTSYWLSICFVVTGLVEAVWGLSQIYGYAPSQHALFRLTGSFFNPGPYACYLAVVLPMTCYYALRYSICYRVRFHFRNMPVYFLWGISVLTFIAIVLVLPASMSRASWMAAIGGCVVVLLYFFSKTGKVKTYIVKNRKKCVFIVFVVLLLFAVGVFGTYHLKKDSADGRTFIWKNTIELIKQKPFGVGLGHFSGSYGHIQATYFESGNGTADEERVADCPEYAFNEYLQICAEQGIAVFLLFAGIVSYSLFIGFKRKKIAATSSFVALLIAASVSYPFSVLPFLIVFVFLLALINKEEKGVLIPKPVSILFAGCCLIIVSLCLYNRYPTYNAYKKWKTLSFTYKYGDTKQASNGYRDLYPYLSDQIRFLFEYAQCLSKSEQYEASNQVLEKAVKISCDPMLYNIMGKNYQALKEYDSAEKSLKKASLIVPNRIYPYYLLMKLYVETGEETKAIVTARIVLTKEPKVQSTAVREMREEAKKVVN